jgi:hypothetical protein
MIDLSFIFEVKNTLNERMTELINLFHNITLFEALIIFDGLNSAIKYMLERLNFDISKTQIVSKKQIISNYNTLYHLSTLDRYLIYSIFYIIHLSFDFYNYFYILSLCFAFPSIQNSIVGIKSVNEWLKVYDQNKLMFINYSISKFIINLIKDLDDSIIEIKNYQIFILYKYLSLNLMFDFLKSYVLIFLLYFLRDKESTYYYYKAVKLAYYYSTGYLFNVISKEDSIFIINIIIREKRWYDISKVKVVHAFYTLMFSKYDAHTKDNMYIYMIRFFTLWSMIAFLKIIHIKLNIILCILFFLISKKTFKMFSKIVLILMLLYVNINDLIISGVFVCYDIIEYIFKDLYFFIENVDDIKKVLIFYNKKIKSKEKKISSEYEII